MVISAARKKGFTIVELLIVIVVIAILATISIAAYNGIQQRANDTRRKNDIASVAKLMRMYAIDNGPMYTGSGCGAGGNGSGWLNYQYSGASSVMDCLKAATATTSTIKDNSMTCSGTSCRAYMLYTCLQGGKVVTYLYANLEGGTHNESELDGTCAPDYDRLYGMNYYTKLVYE